MNSLVLLSTLTLLLHARPCMLLPGYTNQILLKLKDGPLSAGDEVFIDGKFRNRLTLLRFVSISKRCPGPTPQARHVLPQCHPLIMKFRPRYHQIQILYKGHPNMNREVEVAVVSNNNVTIGLSFQLLIKVGKRNFTIFLNGVHIKTMYDEIGHDNIIHVRAYGGYFKKHHITRAPFSLRSRHTCGVRPGLSSFRITGGVNARTGEFPWQAAIRRKVAQPDIPFKHLCGASLISSCWVLTAAHCLADVKVFPTKFVVRVGDYFNGEEDFFSSREAVEEFDIERVIPHEHFRARPSPLHDIALLKLKSNGSKCAKFNDIVWPICLPTRNETKPEGSICTVSGWGAKKWEDRINPTLFPKVLQKADIKIKNHLTCQKSYGTNSQSLGGGYKVPKESVCAADTGKDACQGDSGGPLACRRNTSRGTTFVLWGVTSWGDTCAKPDKPGIYTKVADYLDWIEYNMRD